MDIKTRFQKLRREMGLSAEALSSRLEGSHSLWTQYEAGRRTPSFETLLALKRLGVSIDWLMSGDGHMLLASKKRRKSKPNLPELLEPLEETVMALTEGWLDIWEILLHALEGSPSGLSREELLSLPGLPSHQEVEHELERLKNDGLIAESKGRYYLIRASKKDPRFAEFAFVIAMRELLQYHLPALRRGEQKARLDVGEIKLERGLAVECAIQLWHFIEKFQSKRSSSRTGGERLRIFISTVVEDEQESL
ncbi:MAG: helix-turn-helix domain-containing protein [Myxococcota bacterium]